MICPAELHLVVDPVDMRMGPDRLSAHLQHALGINPCAGHAYAFINRPHSRIKVLLWDANGVWLCQRRLHEGRFHWPRGDASFHPISAELWLSLTSGLDWRRLQATAPRTWQV